MYSLRIDMGRVKVRDQCKSTPKPRFGSYRVDSEHNLKARVVVMAKKPQESSWLNDALLRLRQILKIQKLDTS